MYVWCEALQTNHWVVYMAAGASAPVLLHQSSRPALSRSGAAPKHVHARPTRVFHCTYRHPKPCAPALHPCVAAVQIIQRSAAVSPLPPRNRRPPSFEAWSQIMPPDDLEILVFKTRPTRSGTASAAGRAIGIVVLGRGGIASRQHHVYMFS